MNNTTVDLLHNDSDKKKERKMKKGKGLIAAMIVMVVIILLIFAATQGIAALIGVLGHPIKDMSVGGAFVFGLVLVVINKLLS